MKDLGKEEIKIDIPDISERIDALKKEILDITSTEPYTYRELLENDDAVEKKKTALQEELDTYKKYHEELKEAILQIVSKGGIEIKWRMN